MPSQAEVVAALQAAQPASAGAISVPDAVMALQGAPNQQMAGDVVHPPMGFSNGLNADQLYDRVLRPAGAAAIKSQGGKAVAPPNVLPITPAVGQKMGEAQPMAGTQMAENDAWRTQPLRLEGGQFTMPMTNPSQPLSVSGPAMYQNAMRAIGIKPADYKNK